jgi:hypothetical protein
MTSKTWTNIIALALLETLALPVLMTGQNQHEVNSKHHHYQLGQIPTLGGPGTNFFDNTNNIAVLNDRGSGSSKTGWGAVPGNLSRF